MAPVAMAQLVHVQISCGIKHDPDRTAASKDRSANRTCPGEFRTQVTIELGDRDMHDAAFRNRVTISLCRVIRQCRYVFQTVFDKTVEPVFDLGGVSGRPFWRRFESGISGLLRLVFRDKFGELSQQGLSVVCIRVNQINGDTFVLAPGAGANAFFHDQAQYPLIALAAPGGIAQEARRRTGQACQINLGRTREAHFGDIVILADGVVDRFRPDQFNTGVFRRLANAQLDR